VKNEMERMRKEVVATCFKVLSRRSRGKLWKAPISDRCHRVRRIKIGFTEVFATSNSENHVSVQVSAATTTDPVRLLFPRYEGDILHW